MVFHVITANIHMRSQLITPIIRVGSQEFIQAIEISAPKAKTLISIIVRLSPVPMIKSPVRAMKKRPRR